MLIKDFMTRDVVTVQSNATIEEVRNLLAHSNFHRVPVMEGDQLVGLVNSHRLIGQGPVKYAMVKEPIVGAPDTTIEEAADLMIANQISALPVVAHGELLGIITLRDLFKAGIQALGARKHGVRVTVILPDMRGILADVINALTNIGAYYVSLISLPDPQGRGEMVTIKIQDVTQNQVEEALSDLSIEVYDIRTV
ncbi:MAG: hypothetical protein DSY55_04025 [Clostridia bacterium]|nr:MAG: hypothetical protein DSY55_04025 [Clostridia bacterium]